MGQVGWEGNEELAILKPEGATLDEDLSHGQHEPSCPMAPQQRQRHQTENQQQ